MDLNVSSRKIKRELSHHEEKGGDSNRQKPALSSKNKKPRSVNFVALDRFRHSTRQKDVLLAEEEYLKMIRENSELEIKAVAYLALAKIYSRRGAVDRVKVYCENIAATSGDAQHFIWCGSHPQFLEGDRLLYLIAANHLLTIRPFDRETNARLNIALGILFQHGNKQRLDEALLFYNAVYLVAHRSSLGTEDHLKDADLLARKNDYLEEATLYYRAAYTSSRQDYLLADLAITALRKLAITRPYKESGEEKRPDTQRVAYLLEALDLSCEVIEKMNITELHKRSFKFDMQRAEIMIELGDCDASNAIYKTSSDWYYGALTVLGPLENETDCSRDERIVRMKAYIGLGRKKLRQKDFAGAHEDFERAKIFCPDSGWLNKIQCFEKG